MADLNLTRTELLDLLTLVSPDLAAKVDAVVTAPTLVLSDVRKDNGKAVRLTVQVRSAP